MSGVSQYFLELVAVAIAACSSLLKHQREMHQRSGNMLRLTQAVESPAMLLPLLWAQVQLGVFAFKLTFALVQKDALPGQLLILLKVIRGFVSEFIQSQEDSGLQSTTDPLVTNQALPCL